MAELVNTTQLNTFEIVRDILLTNSTISAKFGLEDIYQYEPKHKSAEFRGFPYIVIKLPSTDTDPLTLSHGTTLKVFNGTILLRLEYLARDKFRDFANAIISTIEGAEETFRSSGYYTPLIELIDVDENTVIDSKELIEGTFELTNQAGVDR